MKNRSFFARWFVGGLAVVAGAALYGETFTWSGGSGVWQTGAVGKFGRMWTDGGDVVFATPTVSATVTVSGVVRPGQIVFSQNPNNRFTTMSAGAADSLIDFGGVQGLIDAGADTSLARNQINVSLAGSAGLALYSGASNAVGSTGYFVLGADNRQLTGGISIEKGIVTVGHQYAFGENAVTLRNGGGIGLFSFYEGSIANDIVVENSGVLRTAGRTGILEGNVSGSGHLTIGNNNSLKGISFTADNAFTGTISIEGGRVSIGEGGYSGSFDNVSAIEVKDSATGLLVFSRADNITVAADISGEGRLEKNGEGKLTYTGNSTAAGSLNVAMGTFENKGSVSGDVLVQKDAAYIAGAGSSTGNITVNENASLIAGGTMGTLTLGSTGLGSVSLGFSEVGISAKGIVTRAGAVDLDCISLYQYFSQEGGKTYLFDDFNASAVDLSKWSVTQDTRANLALGKDANGVYISYDSNAQAQLVWSATGDAGVWDASAKNWTNEGQADRFYNMDYVNFDDSAAAKTVELSGELQAAGVTVDTAGMYTFSGTGTFSGSGSLEKRGSGELIVENANSYSGGTFVEEGTLTVRTADALGTGTVLTSPNGTLNFDYTGNWRSDLVLEAEQRLNLAVASGREIALNGLLLGEGSQFSASGEGVLQLTGMKGFSGEMEVGGHLIVSSLSGIFDGDVSIVEGGMVQYIVDNQQPLGGNIVLEGGEWAISTLTAEAADGGVFSAALSGQGDLSLSTQGRYSVHFSGDSQIALERGSLINVQSGTVYLDGGADFDGNSATLNLEQNTYFDFRWGNRAVFGGLTGSGTVQASAENTAGGFSGNTLVIGNGALVGDVHVFSGIIAAGGNQPDINYQWEGQSSKSAIQLEKIGASTQVITGYNMAAQTTIQEGMLQFGDGTTNGHQVGAYVCNNAQLAVNNAASQYFTAAVSGTGDFVKQGSGVLTLNSKSSYQGDTLIQEGTLRLGATGLAKGTTIMPYGDSITAGLGGDHSGYRGYLADLFIANGMQTDVSFAGTETLTYNNATLSSNFLHHSGISGDTIVRNIAGGDRHNLEQQRIAMKPDALLLHFGVNDLTAGVSTTNPTGTYPVASVAANMISLLKDIEDGSPDTTVFLATIVPAFGPGAPTPQEEKYAKIEQFNEWIREFCNDPGSYDAALANAKIVLVDFEKLGYPASDKYTLQDSLHPNNSGYAWMAQQWYAAVLETLGEDVSQALPSGTTVRIAEGATLDVNNMQASIGALQGQGNVSLGSGTLTIGMQGVAADSSFSGNISGTGGIIKQGQGLLLLSGGGDYRGNTSVQQGRMRVEGALASARVDVASGAAFEGNGRIQGALEVQGALALKAGDTLTLEQGATIASGGVFEITVDASGKTGTLVFEGGEFVLEKGAQIVIVNPEGLSHEGDSCIVFSGVEASGSLFGESEVYQFTSKGHAYSLSKDGVLTAIPEPCAGLAPLLAAVATIAWRRKKAASF